jgi:hypothetical protein
MGEADFRDEAVPKRLDEKADKLIKLRADIANLRLQGPAKVASFAEKPN